MQPDNRIDFGACTHAGFRKGNEDFFRIPGPGTAGESIGLLFAVADGMGGHSGGEIASRLACEKLDEFYRRGVAPKESGDIRSLSRRLEDAVVRVDQHLRLRGFHDEKLAEMGTTLSCLVLKESKAVIAHVGDSRIYRLRGEHLTCLTTDHTFVQDMIFEGEVDPRDAHRHPFRHMLTRVIGTEEPLTQVDLRIDRVKAGDRYLLSTDGLHGSVEHDQIRTALAEGAKAADTAENLVKNGLRNNARDDLTAVVIFLRTSQ